MVADIQHVLCLMLENRSFDHMLGFVDHPAHFEGLRAGRSDFTDGGIAPTPTQRYEVAVGPAHTHRAVMRQIGSAGRTGFVASYREHVRRQGCVARLRADPAAVMRCFHPQMVPVLATLAREYALLDHWFSSVPGGTFPNRDFALAGTSFGFGQNPRDWRELLCLQRRHAEARTIFHEIDAQQRSFAVYCQQLSGVDSLYDYPGDRGRVFELEDLMRDIRQDTLPDFGFIEPNYGLWGEGNSQHPEQSESLQEFVAGEALIARIYHALVDHPEVFQKTVLLLTYDEHGGFYDHVLPPDHQAPGQAGRAATPPDSYVLEGDGRTFGFDRLGVRVPAVVISPHVRRGHVDSEVRDHTSLLSSLRHLRMPDAQPLRARDAVARGFQDVLQLPAPRRSLPRVSPLEEAEAERLQRELTGATAGGCPLTRAASQLLRRAQPAPGRPARLNREILAAALADGPAGADGRRVSLDEQLARHLPTARDVQAFAAERQARRARRRRRLEVRRPDGTTRDEPDEETLEVSLDQLRNAPREACLRLVDGAGNALFVSSGGSLRAQVGDTLQATTDTTPEGRAALLRAFAAGDLAAVLDRLSSRG